VLRRWLREGARCTAGVALLRWSAGEVPASPRVSSFLRRLVEVNREPEDEVVVFCDAVEMRPPMVSPLRLTVEIFRASGAKP